MRIGPLGLWELLILLVLVLFVFGPSRLPAMARGIGQAIREFRRGVRADPGTEGDEEGEAGAPPAPASREAKG